MLLYERRVKHQLIKPFPICMVHGEVKVAVDKNFEPHRYEMLCITHWRGKLVLASYEDTYYSVLIILYNVRLSSLWFNIFLYLLRV